MSIVTSTAEQICHSPTNSSKAKMLYSFPKSSRFPKSKQFQCDKFYEIDRNSNQRTTSLGYGKKYDFTKDFPITPAPGSYQNQTTFEMAKKKKKGFGFGSGRGQMESTGLIKKNQNPGPGAYEPQSPRKNLYSSLKGKAKIDNRQQIYVPGPGTYQTISSFNKTGQVFFSKFQSKSAIKFSKQQKLKVQNRRVPGPGTYNSSKAEFSPDGKYFFSRLQSAKTSKFGKTIRLPSQNRCQTPGPGNYRLPSQFGYYRSKHALQQITNQTSHQF